MALQIVGAAYPRTGTFSLKLALEQLGFGPCHHMAEVLVHPETAPLWIAAFEGRPDWQAIFRDYRSCVDAPSCFFWRDIWAAYPDAKVILTERDPESWFESTQATVFSQAWIETLKKLPLREFFDKMQAPLADHIHDRDFMIAGYKAHCDDVKRTVPADRLLVLRMGEGWEPLCRFLNVPVPAEPYPKSNTRDELKAMMAMIDQQGGQFDVDAIAQHTHRRSLKSNG